MIDVFSVLIVLDVVTAFAIVYVAVGIYLTWGDRIFEVVGRSKILSFSILVDFVSIALIDYLAGRSEVASFAKELRLLILPVFFITLISFMVAISTALTYLPKEDDSIH